VPAIACLDLPALPLQLAWRDEPELRTHPVVVIDEDRPQGIVLWACERARAAAVLPGQRYAHALGLLRGLRARVIPPARIEAALTELREALHALSPRVEPSDEPGTFWLDGDGLERIAFEPSKRGRAIAALPIATDRLASHAAAGSAWGLAIQRTVASLGYTGAVVVGFSRFATYAIARATRTGITILRNDADERAAAAAVPLARLDLDSKLRDSLARLGVTKLGEMVRLPGGGILERFGKEAHRMYQLAAGERWDPIVPLAPPEAPDERILLDDDVEDSEQLVFVLRPAIDRLLDRLASRGRAVTALHVELVLRFAVGETELRAECIKPAQPTLDGRALLRVLFGHLRLSVAFVQVLLLLLDANRAGLNLLLLLLQAHQVGQAFEPVAGVDVLRDRRAEVRHYLAPFCSNSRSLFSRFWPTALLPPPIALTEAASTTCSPFDSIAGTLSSRGPPGP